MIKEKYDIVIIGGGHNGLVCAAYLAKGGLSVKVLEKRGVVGGAAVTEEFAPGFKNSTCSYTVGLLSPRVVNDLNLYNHGLKLVPRPMLNFIPTSDGNYLKAYADREKFKNEIARHCVQDAEAFSNYDATISEMARVIRDQLHTAPPNVGGGYKEIFKAWRLSKKLTKVKAETRANLLEIFTVSAASFLSRWFKNDTLKALLAFDGIVGNLASPHEPGTAYVLMHHSLGEIMPKGSWGHAIGGMGSISNAIATEALNAGVSIETNKAVTKLLVDDDSTVFGVEMKDGKQIHGRAIVSNINPKLLFLDFLEASQIPESFRNGMQRFKCVSGSFRMNVALSELPDFSCSPGKSVEDHHGAGIILAPTMAYQHQALEDAKKNGWSTRPIVEMVIPSTLDDSLAPSGKHVASLFCQHFLPNLPDNKMWDSCQEAAANSVINLVSEFAPNFQKSIIAQKILSPLQLEQEFGLLGGDIFHGALDLNQIWSSRPQLGHAAYRMPLKGLYLCGAGAHPGGGVTGIPGHNAAKEILHDFKWWNKIQFGNRFLARE